MKGPACPNTMLQGDGGRRYRSPGPTRTVPASEGTPDRRASTATRWPRTPTTVTPVTQVLSGEGRYLPKGSDRTVKMASTVQRDPVGSISGFVIVLLVFIFGSFVPAPLWLRLAVLAVATLFAVKGGVSGLDVITLGFVVFMIGGSLISGAYTATTDAADLEEPIPVPSGYASNSIRAPRTSSTCTDPGRCHWGRLKWRPSRSSITTSMPWHRNGP
jgi:hypothetical protein